MKSIFKNISAFYKTNKCQIIVFTLFAFVLFVKVLLFQNSIFNNFLFKSILNQPGEFFRFWNGKIIAPIIIASFVFITKRHWWTIVASVVIDVWLIANLFYFKAQHLFLSMETMQMADNMNGFWDSLSAYVGWDLFAVILITIVYSVLLFFIKRKNKVKARKPVLFLALLLFSLCLIVIDNVLYRQYTHKWAPQNEATEKVREDVLANKEYHYYYPFGNVYYYARVEASTDYNYWAYMYINDQSIISYFPAMLLFGSMQSIGDPIILTDDQKEEISNYVQDAGQPAKPQSNLIIIMVESLESWALDDVCGYSFMPRLKKLSQDNNVLFCDKMQQQVRHGNSADGQMICVTGILPISNGATCILYGQNQFPSVAELYDKSAVVNPTPGTWRQSTMTKSYHFQKLIEPSYRKLWSDKEVAGELINFIDTVQGNFCVLGITVSSHVPFSYGSTHEKYKIKDMPVIMSAYLNSMYFADSCIGLIIDRVLGSDLAENTAIVITGDHTVFRTQDNEFDQFAKNNGVNMETGKTSVPLIVYSKEIGENTVNKELCYQMDVYPTIMDVLGCKNYYWQGFGVSLIDSTGIKQRTVSENEAYSISDLIIRGDYFNSKK